MSSRVFDEDGSNTIDFEEFMLASNFNNTSPEDKLGEQNIELHWWGGLLWNFQIIYV